MAISKDTRMIKKSLYSLLRLALSIAVIPPSAEAFHVPEHVKITQRSVDGLRKCGLLPREWDQSWTNLVSTANENEDYDLFRKWSKYSHYYNPDHTISQNRADSALSISESVASIIGNPNDVATVNSLIGRIIHHVQDSSVPAHAIPVAHADHDGFESMNVSELYNEPFSMDECQSLAAAEPLDVLHANAIETLTALSEPISFKRETFFKTGTWLGTFWAASEGNGFGEYGSLGDNFGKAQFILDDGRTVLVNPSLYREFKRARVAAAIRSTQRVILWANKLRGI